MFGLCRSKSTLQQRRKPIPGIVDDVVAEPHDGDAVSPGVLEAQSEVAARGEHHPERFVEPAVLRTRPGYRLHHALHQSLLALEYRYVFVDCILQGFAGNSEKLIKVKKLLEPVILLAHVTYANLMVPVIVV